MKRFVPRPPASLIPPALAALVLTALLAGACAKPAAEVPPGDLMQLDELAAIVTDSTAVQPILLHIGFEPLYRSGRIPGSRFVGPGNKPEGLAALKAALAEAPRDRAVVLYCGCCPWNDCPNVRPAYEVAKASGHPNVKLLYVTGNLERDWIQKGLPAAKGSD
jgi:hypothetical protein